MHHTTASVDSGIIYAMRREGYQWGRGRGPRDKGGIGRGRVDQGGKVQVDEGRGNGTVTRYCYMCSTEDHISPSCPQHKEENEQGQTHSQLGQGNVDRSELLSVTGAVTIENIIEQLNSQVQLLMSTTQAPSQTTKEEQDLSSSILGFKTARVMHVFPA